jgi:hypothetical protein
MVGKTRCRMHGGTRRGRLPYYQIDPTNRNKALATKRALYKQLGLLWPGGRRHHTVERQMMARKIVARTKKELATGLPNVIADTRPLAELAPTEALARIAWKGLERLDEILSIEIPKDDKLEMRENMKIWRLVGDMALGANRLLAHVGEGGARVQRDQQLALLLEEIRRDKEQARLGKVTARQTLSDDE